MIRQNITRDHDWFTGERKKLIFEVLDDTDSTPLDIASASFSWFLKANESDLDATALLTKTSVALEISVIGVFDADRAVNSQRVQVDIDAADTRAITGWLENSGLTYWHELKRTDIELVIVKGTVILQQSLHRSAP